MRAVTGENASHRILFLDYLRGLACMLVVFAHVCDVAINAPETVTTWLPFIRDPIFGPDGPSLSPFNTGLYAMWSTFGISTGALGVGIFFLISGFVIISAVDREGPAVFAVRRFFRIVPVALTISCATAIFVGYLCNKHGVSSPDNMESTIATGFAVAGFLRITPTIPIIWSLSVEVMFYAVIAALTLDIRRIGFAQIITTSAACACYAISLKVHEVLAILPPFAVVPLNFASYLAAEIPFLLLGSAIYRAHQARWSIGATSAVVVAAAIHFAVVQMVDAVAPDLGTTTIGSSLAAIVIFAVAMAIGQSWPVIRGLRLLGDISYPLYLLHVPLAWAILAWLASRGIGMVSAMMLTITAVLILAWVVHVTVERWSQVAGRRVSRMIVRERPGHGSVEPVSASAM